LKLREFARTDVKSERIYGSDDEDDIRYLPPDLPQPSSGRRRSRSRSPQYDDVPRFRDEKPFFGPKTLDGSIKVKYPSIIDGYSQDDKELSEMDKLGLPTGFSFQQGGGLPEKQKKGDKKTFYCEICLIELNSLDTMKSHVSGVKHMKKKLQLEQQRDEKIRKGEISEQEARKAPGVVPIPNPENTKKKVPIRLHEKIKETREPVVGLDFVKEWIAVSDPEMEPHYECGLCGNKGIANGMFSHIMGYKHRQAFVEEMHKEDPSNVLQLSQRELLDFARRMAENGDDLTTKIKTRRSDEEYPWPTGKAPWSVERGGTGIPPDRARENWGRNNECEDVKPTVVEVVTRRNEKSPKTGTLPSPSNINNPKNDVEAIKMLELGQKLLELGTQYIGPQLSFDEKNILHTLKSSIVAKILTKRQVSLPPQGRELNGHHSPARHSHSSSSSSRSRRRPFNSRSPSPKYKRERRSHSRSPSRQRQFNGSYDDRERRHQEDWKSSRERSGGSGRYSYNGRY